MIGFSERPLCPPSYHVVFLAPQLGNFTSSFFSRISDSLAVLRLEVRGGAN